MIRLEAVLLDETGDALDLYLEDSKTKDIMADIKYIKQKAAGTTETGRLRMAIQTVLDETK
jgi:hypothetical protein